MPNKRKSTNSPSPDKKSPRTAPSRRGRTVTAADRIAIVQARFEGYRKRGQATPLTEIQQHFKHPPSVLSRIIASAFKEGLVDVVGKNPSSQPAREEGLEGKLITRFKQLRKAIVIRLPDGLTLEQRHQSLGGAASQFLAQERLHDGARVGVGCGGAVFHTMSKLLRDWAPLPFEDVTIFSLTGSMYSNLPDRIWHDADFNAGMFAACFAPTQNVKIRVTGSRLVAQPVPKESYFSLDNFEKEHPELAILGVGPGHRFLDEAKGKGEPLLQPIHNELTELLELCKPRIPDSDYTLSPLGSMCNHLFLIRHPEGKPSPNESHIIALIQKINRQLLNMDDAHLKLIPNLLVIAGGSQKAYAIREVLLQPEIFKVRVLITDVQAAQLILS
jgi:hypothetical protein